MLCSTKRTSLNSACLIQNSEGNKKKNHFVSQKEDLWMQHVWFKIQYKILLTRARFYYFTMKMVPILGFRVSQFFKALTWKTQNFESSSMSWFEETKLSIPFLTRPDPKMIRLLRPWPKKPGLDLKKNPKNQVKNTGLTLNSGKKSPH